MYSARRKFRLYTDVRMYTDVATTYVVVGLVIWGFRPTASPINFGREKFNLPWGMTGDIDVSYEPVSVSKSVTKYNIKSDKEQIYIYTLSTIKSDTYSSYLIILLVHYLASRLYYYSAKNAAPRGRSIDSVFLSRPTYAQ